MKDTPLKDALEAGTFPPASGRGSPQAGRMPARTCRACAHASRILRRHATIRRMDTARARAIAEQLHQGHRQEDGTLLLDHIGRVARAASTEARAVAWLHEALEMTSVSERELIMDGLTDDELRAL